MDAGDRDQTRHTLFLLAVEQATQIHKLLVGNVLIVDADPLALPTEEVSGVDGTRAAAIDCIKALPAVVIVSTTDAFGVPFLLLSACHVCM